MLKINNLTFSVGDKADRTDILRGITVDIPDNRFVVITGPNGGGKTTLAKAIMGIVQPTSGSIYWNNTDITAMSITERAKLGISYGFQQPPRFKGLRVYDLLTMASGRSMGHDESCRYLTQVGLCAKDYIDREVNAALSGGEVKRIEIATILAKDSPLMIFDEPEAGIDLWSFSKLTETFRAIHARKNSTILIISHQERIISMADEVLLLADGVLADRGKPAEIMPKILGTTVQICSVLASEKEGAR